MNKHKSSYAFGVAVFVYAVLFNNIECRYLIVLILFESSLRAVCGLVPL
ncbi:hypothetical protein CZ797_10425 [Pseudoalteromonas sp. JB197]|nr:hypothetical protein CZ797_10425 [Pseudoalteromonas sp. JB197]